MKSWLVTVAVVLAVSAWAARDARADSYRCGRRLIYNGDSTSDVLRLCGEPLARDHGHETVEIDGVAKSVSVQRWYYRKSRRSLGRVVMIYRGEVVAIETGSR